MITMPPDDDVDEGRRDVGVCAPLLLLLLLTFSFEGLEALAEAVAASYNEGI